MSKTPDFPYLHGFSKDEQERLRKQARFGEHTVYQNINFSGVRDLLEVGCGVGAQSEILLRRFPDLNLTGIDRSPKQLAAADLRLSSLPFAEKRFTLKEMDATAMEFSANSFDGAFLCWILEHVPDPIRVLSEVRRVLRPGSVVYVTEVMNASFFLDPYSPNVWKYWMAFNEYQLQQKGDPFVGAKLGNFMMQLGYHDINTEVKTWFLDNRYPQARKDCVEYWTELLLSASDQLVAAQCVSEDVVQGMKEEMAKVANDPNAVFYYSFIQARART
ncbi:methyltransferase domain-containing protein [Bdellovibrio sp. 22V]|uniref:class I SAM-dependent methyltransferase n=1 Tax=Bdellovibrio TaxID=958 RepID=UPI002543B215|nr:class I SAM-dependent methyltransferase [Bdellovibrio sp. 22V]WII71269.1 methyltransferase domain-containing protein [Bdellovibrio sp. 22V]